MADEKTFDDFFNKLHSGFRRTGNSVIIHFNTPHGFCEYKKDYFEKVANSLETQIMLAVNKIEPLNPVTQLVIDLLYDAY